MPQTKSPNLSPAALWLTRLRAIARAMLVAQRLNWVLAWTLAVLLVAGAADFVLRTPAALRTVLWLIGAAVLVALFRRVILPAIRFQPRLTEVALRIESSPPGRSAGLTGILASGLELGESVEPRPLADRVIADARVKLGTLTTAGLLAPTRTARSLVWLLAAIGAVVVVGLLEPANIRIGAARILWPVGGAQWPKRTGVADVTGLTVHPLGSALALRAAVTRGGSGVSGASGVRVAANYRTISRTASGDEAAGPLRRVLLTAQDKMVRIEPSGRATIDTAPSSAGHLFERLLEPSGLGADTAARARTSIKGQSPAPAAPTELTLEYFFETEDDRTEPARVLLVEPPSVVRASAIVTLPDYAASMPGILSSPATGAPAGHSPGAIDLGPGSDERAAPPPVLAGSRIQVRIDLNKTVPGLPDSAPPAAVAEWAARTLGPDAAALLASESAGASLRTAGASWTLSWTITDPLRLTPKPVDVYGIAGVEEASYRFDALTDKPPSVVITAPMEDKSVLATAIVEVAAEARDDVGLSRMSIEHQSARKPKGSEGAPAEPLGERVEFAIGELPPQPAAPAAGADASPTDVPDSRKLTSRHSLELTDLDLKPGDELWLTAAATDAYELAGARHETVRSGIRKLRIMSREELVQQLWSELGAVRRTAMKIDEDQKEIAKGTASRIGPDEARRAERAQTGITERVASQAEAIDKLEERIDENGLTDQTLGDVLNQARDTLGKAGEKSVEASAALNKAEKAESQETSTVESGKQDRADAAAAQDDVRDELGKLIDMLDQGEDTYAAKRAIEQALVQQKALRDRTQQAGQKTTGKNSEQLSPQENQDLQQIAQEQQDAAEKMRDAIEKMLEREQKLQKNDAAAAQQMAQAAKRGQREQVAEKMQEASKQVQQNQTNTAQQQQSRAIQSMEQMLKELDKTNQARDEVLRRYLATLMDSLKALIQQQEDRLAELDRAIADKQFAGLDAGMVRLHQATLGVLDEARGAPREAADALALIERAADAMAAAVVGLRDNPVNDDEVKAQEQLSLEKLNEALGTAEKLDEAAEEREQDRKRGELRSKYEEALKTQLGIRESALGLVGAEASRRNKAGARQLSQDQETLRLAVEAIRAEIKELKEAKVFDYAHTRLNDLMTAAAATLAEGESTQDVTRRQTSAARVLASIVDALDDRKKDDKKFREREQDQQGSGGGGGEQPLVPPAAEIKLLRAMQQEAAERTRDVGEGTSADGTTVDEVSTLQRELAGHAKELLDRLSKRERPDSQKPQPGIKPIEIPDPAPEDPPEAQP